MKIGILCAMSVEYKQMAAMMSHQERRQIGPHTFLEGQIGSNTVVLLQCGIGKVNAAAGVTSLIMNYKPQCVISTGVAGGIDTRLQVMDVVAGSRVAYHDVDCGPDYDPGQVQDLPRIFEGDSALLRKIRAMEKTVKIVEGLICTGDQFITDPQQLCRIKTMWPDALAVDMESASIAQVCHLFKIPFLSFRIISDTPSVDKHFEQYLNFWDTMADKSFTVTKEFLLQI